jgi:hypothetical protein
MSMRNKKQQILQILYENLSTAQPQVVHSELIASKLKMSTKDTCQLLKIMHEMGVVVSDMEGQNSLITKEGLANMGH